MVSSNGVEDGFAIPDDRKWILAAVGQIRDEGQRTAQTFAMFQIGIGAWIDHKNLRKSGLSQVQVVSASVQALRHVGFECAFAVVLHEMTSFCSLKFVLILTKSGGASHEAYTRKWADGWVILRLSRMRVPPCEVIELGVHRLTPICGVFLSKWCLRVRNLAYDYDGNRIFSQK